MHVLLGICSNQAVDMFDVGSRYHCQRVDPRAQGPGGGQVQQEQGNQGGLSQVCHLGCFCGLCEDTDWIYMFPLQPESKQQDQ